MTRILVVDDDEGNLTFYDQVLALESYAVARARDGIEALEMFDKFQPDIVLLDVMMPRLNGYDVCRRLKHNRHARPVPILILTANDEEEARTLALRVGADDFLLKPCTPVELLGHVQMLLSRAALPPLDALPTTA